MRQILLFILLNLSVNLFATVRTVSNYPANLAPYSTIQAAIDASVSGDTIYVHGSPTTYNGFTITNKRLTIIGPGWAPDKDYFPFKATVSGISIIEGTGSNRTEIQGLVFGASLSMTTNSPDSLRFIRNQFKDFIHMQLNLSVYSDYVFQGNFFDGAHFAGSPSTQYKNFDISNNIFYGITGDYSFYGFTNSVNVLFDHNLWYGSPGSVVNCFAGDCKYLLITNNIFVRRNAATNNSLSTFNNNITFNAGVNNPWAVNGNIDGLGNVENQDPQMADQVSVNDGINNPLLNFIIAAGPANNAGSDGKDIGLLYDATGVLNWNNSRMSRLPMIYSMKITNPTIAAGGTLNVQVEARKNN